MLTLNQLAKEIHKNADEHGWWEEERALPEILCLCHSELSEALEEYRNGNDMVWVGEGGKPEGVATEMVDCVIRIFDYLAHMGVDIDGVMRQKMEYNLHRPYRHGGKVC